jgi:hypothetical protein
MSKPITARQLAAIIWGPVILALVAWATVSLFNSSKSASEARSAATKQSEADTERSARQLQRNLDLLNAQVEDAQQQPR